jgi:hypothetical protein
MSDHFDALRATYDVPAYSLPMSRKSPAEAGIAASPRWVRAFDGDFLFVTQPHEDSERAFRDDAIVREKSAGICPMP